MINKTPLSSSARLGGGVRKSPRIQGNEGQNVSFRAAKADLRLWLRSVAAAPGYHLLPEVGRFFHPDSRGGHLRPPDSRPLT